MVGERTRSLVFRAPVIGCGTSRPPPSGESCGLGSEVSRGFRAAHSGAAPNNGSAAVQQGPPRERLGQGGHFAKHDLDDVPDPVGGIVGSSGTFQATINEQLQQIEGEHPKQQHGQQSIVGVAENMVQIPVANKLVEARILEVPAGPADLQGCAAGHPAGPLANDGKTPSARCLVGSRDDGPDYPNFPTVGVEGLDLIRIPELDLLLAFGILVALTGSLALP